MNGLSALSEAEQIYTELRRRMRERELSRYAPSEPQAAFHNSPHKIRLYIGCNGSGKTTCLVADAAAYMLGYRPWDGKRTRTPPTKCVLLCQDFQHAAVEDLTPKIEKFLPDSMIVNRARLANGKIHKWTLSNGSSLNLMSYEQDPFAFEGIDWDFAGFNEPPPRSIWIPTFRGVSKSGGRAAFAMTAIGGESAWIFDELYSVAGTDPDIFQVSADHRHMFMSEHDKRLFEASLGEDEKEARWHGRFRHLVGRVYKEYDSGIHVVKGDRLAQVQEWIQSPEIPKGMVVDPHDRRPFAMAWFLVSPQGHIIFFREWPEDDFQSYKSCNYSVPQYAKYILDTERDNKIGPVIWRFMDPNYGIQRRSITGESIVDRFGDLGLAFDAQINDSIEDGHLAVKERLLYDSDRPFGADNSPRIFFTPGLMNMEYALTHYVWTDKPTAAGYVKEKVAESGKDFADLLRYTCVVGPGYFNPHSASVRPKRELFRGTL